MSVDDDFIRRLDAAHVLFREFLSAGQRGGEKQRRANRDGCLVASRHVVAPPTGFLPQCPIIALSFLNAG